MRVSPALEEPVVRPAPVEVGSLSRQVTYPQDACSRPAWASPALGTQVAAAGQRSRGHVRAPRPPPPDPGPPRPQGRGRRITRARAARAGRSQWAGGARMTRAGGRAWGGRPGAHAAGLYHHPRCRRDGK